MGGGSYDYISARSRSTSSSHRSNTEIFRQRSISDEMNIRGKIREARDSEEHPNSTPIIIGVDVTGSMGYLSEEIIKNSLDKLMKKMYQKSLLMN